MLENLEQRRLFAILVSGGVLQLNGYANGSANALELILNGSTIQLRNANSLAVIDSAPAAGVTGAKIDLLGGNDLFRVGRPDGTMMPTNVAVSVTGNAGDDSLTGGVKSDSLFGDIGNDYLDGGAAGDSIFGGAGFDTINYSYRANQVKFKFGAGGGGTNAGTNASPAQYNDNGGDTNTGMEAVLSGSGNDSLVGTAAAEWFDGGAGNDSIYAGDGVDTINGGVGADLAYGEGGDDYFFIQDNTGDKFLGGTGTTFAQYDVTTDIAAPVLGSSPSTPAALTASFVAITPTATGLVPQLVGPDSSPDFIPDDTFGTGGKTITLLDGTEVQINDLKIQQIFDGDVLIDEKFLVVGTAQGPNENNDFVVIRYNNDGTLDSTFGEDGTGIVYTDFSDEYNFVQDDETRTNDVASSLIIDENGNIVVAGTATPSEGQSLIAIARYDSNGNLDSAFGDEGVEVLNAADSGADQTGARIAVQDVFNGDTTEQEYVIAGTITPITIDLVTDISPNSVGPTGSVDFLATRIFSNGELDFNFGNGQGYTQTDYFADTDVATGLAIDPATNNIWISGYTQNIHTTNFLIAGYDQDGNPIAGALTNYDFGADDFAYASVISESKLIVVGSTGFGDSTEGAILAINIDPDSFYYPGQVTNNYYVFDSNGSVVFNAVTLDGEGNAVAAGSINNDDFYVYRFNASDLTTVGVATPVDFATDGDTQDIAFGVQVESDGKLIVAGTSDNAAAITRLEEFHLVDVQIDASTFNFTYTDETGTHPIPTYLSNRITSLSASGIITINGTNNDDKITVVESGDPIITVITTNLNGTAEIDYDSSQVTGMIFNGLDGNDSILADANFPVPVTMNGGNGNDCLRGGLAGDSIHGNSGNDNIDAGAGDDSVYGDDGNDSIKGGDGNDIVLGGSGNDCLQGNNGRDILIGGGDSDRADGGAGDDILTGGSTAYDGNGAALAALMAEWVRTDETYAVRVNHITNGGGLNGSIKLNATTVTSGKVPPDSLTGGADTDLFFAASSGDKILDFDKRHEISIIVHG